MLNTKNALAAPFSTSFLPTSFRMPSARTLTAVFILTGVFGGLHAGESQNISSAPDAAPIRRVTVSKISSRHLIARQETGKQNNAAKLPVWEAKGTLFEACSCSVPCPCNFGQPPTNSYCHTIYAYRLKTARYEGVALDGLVFGGGEGTQGAMGFIDTHATALQRPILEKLALAVFGKGGASGGMRKFVPVNFTVSDTPTQFRLEFGESGGFTANVLIGADGKTPIIVENNTTWPVRRFIKGKTTHFDYKDALGNRLQFEGVNANLGEFSLAGNANLSGKTASCCTPKTK